MDEKEQREEKPEGQKPHKKISGEDKPQEEPAEEEEITYRKGLRGLLDRWRVFAHRVPVAAKAIIAILILVSITGASITAYTTYNFTQNDPSFCNSCHIMNESYDAWQKSEHAGINCHECHHLSVAELNALMVSAFIKRTEKVPVRYGKVIVPWKYCVSCHWEENEHYPEVKKINNSTLHARHYFMEKIECSKCHGYRLHKFNLEERYCINCHEGKVVHGKGMGGLACLNCHTDRTPDMLPGPNKCLYCHGDETVREMLVLDDTIDVKYFQPSEELVKKATKIERPANAPMQFFCYQCHQPHEQIRPDYGTCMSCHAKVVNVGRHKLHIQTVGLECTECHKPHSWRVSIEQAKTLCAECHDYVDPREFLGGEV